MLVAPATPDPLTAYMNAETIPKYYQKTCDKKNNIKIISLLCRYNFMTTKH